VLVALRSAYPDLIRRVEVQQFREDYGSYELVAVLFLQNDTQVHVKEYVFPSGQRKYAYHWQTSDGTLILRWDNAPHWPDQPTHPRHVHQGCEESVSESSVDDLFGVMDVIRRRLQESADG
jgi:hypothetical protein